MWARNLEECPEFSSQPWGGGYRGSGSDARVLSFKSSSSWKPCSVLNLRTSLTDGSSRPLCHLGSDCCRALFIPSPCEGVWRLTDPV